MKRREFIRLSSTIALSLTNAQIFAKENQDEGEKCNT